jgi:hypothetical protein
MDVRQAQILHHRPSVALGFHMFRVPSLRSLAELRAEKSRPGSISSESLISIPNADD